MHWTAFFFVCVWATFKTVPNCDHAGFSLIITLCGVNTFRFAHTNYRESNCLCITWRNKASSYSNDRLLACYCCGCPKRTTTLLNVLIYYFIQGLFPDWAVLIGSCYVWLFFIYYELLIQLHVIVSICYSYLLKIFFNILFKEI